MRIGHVVTYVDSSMSYGGPVSVARQHVNELARRGHTVEFFAGWDGRAAADVAPAVAVHLRKVSPVVGSGFTRLFSADIIRAIAGRARGLDVLHVHLGRDLIGLAAVFLARARGVPVVVQTHGMIVPDTRPAVKIVDTLATKRALTGAAAVLYLVEDERRHLSQLVRSLDALVQIDNGVTLPELSGRGPTGVPRVVFCARLHPRKRVMAFAYMADQLLRAGADVDFVVAGADEGDLAELLRFIHAEPYRARIQYVGAVSSSGMESFLGSASIYVLPSEREPFPMTLLEAMSLGIPCVITDGCMIADRVSAGGVSVTDGSVDALVRSVDNLLREPCSMKSRGAEARALIASRFSIRSVVDRLEGVYMNAGCGRHQG